MGEVASSVLAGLAPLPPRCDSIVEAWEQLLPPGLRAHCRIGGLRGGCLRIAVDGPSYMYELQLCKDELLGELQRLCPGAGLHQVQLGVARD
jgi:hypothetical protein